MIKRKKILNINVVVLPGDVITSDLDKFYPEKEPGTIDCLKALFHLPSKYTFTSSKTPYIAMFKVNDKSGYTGHIWRESKQNRIETYYDLINILPHEDVGKDKYWFEDLTEEQYHSFLKQIQQIEADSFINVIEKELGL